ncbi:uncharacterized protein LOC110467397 isoform X2 [Mizuhopecten yessoensis]|uniref:uncharacterized protein LOC110467397 isoform X2 n=1 Tax=Mizuhopecten yessoensis TaxID=6573 RepID=UPI000B45836F|nr:uncharacterized protein LOC110467397 isoform X2 [Mizuhopecten yessoensis]
MEVGHATKSGPGAVEAIVSEGVDMIDYRQKLVKLADTSEAGWRAVDEYIVNPIAEDSEDEKRMDRATNRANRKMKAVSKSKSARGGRRFNTPYQRFGGPTATITSNTTDSSRSGPAWRAQRPGLCYSCGKPGHWRLECPGVSGGMAATNGSKISKFCYFKHVLPDGTPLCNSDEARKGDVKHSDVLNVNLSSMKGKVSESPMGRLRQRVDFWREKGTCDAVLSIVSDGYKIPFRVIPTGVYLHNNKSARNDPVFVGSEIGKLLGLGLVSEVVTQPCIVNPLTVAYNRAGKPRLVLDCRHINPHLHKFKFKYEDARTARDLFTEGEFLFTFDLKSAYHHVEIFPSHRTFLGFSWEDQGITRYYIFNVLPFGIATAGYVFTKVLREVVKHVRSEGHKLIMYLDDGIGGHENQGGANEASRYVQRVLFGYGFLIADDKCQWQASQCVTWLGYTWSMAEGVVRVTEVRLEGLLGLLRHTMSLVNQRGQMWFTARYVASIIGVGLERTLKDAINASGVTEGSYLYCCSEGMAVRLLSSKSENTNKKYSGSFRRWQSFITSHGFPDFPASPIHVALYLNHLLDIAVQCIGL